MIHRDREQRNKMKRMEIQVWVWGKMEQRIEERKQRCCGQAMGRRNGAWASKRGKREAVESSSRCNGSHSSL